MRLKLIKYCVFGLLLSGCSWASPETHTNEFIPSLPRPLSENNKFPLAKPFVVPGSPDYPDWYNEKLRNAVVLPPGYIWTSADKTAVKWVPGLPVKDYPHVITAEQEGYWIPQPGYYWLTKPTRDYKTVWTPGATYDSYQIMASTVEGYFIPSPGYMWTEGEPLSLRPDPVLPIRKRFSNLSNQFSMGDVAAATKFVETAGQFFEAAHRAGEMALFKVDCIRTERRERQEKQEREAKDRERSHDRPRSLQPRSPSGHPQP